MAKKIVEMEKEFEKEQKRRQKFLDDALSEKDAAGLTIYERTIKRIQNLEKFGKALYDFFDPEENLFDEIYSMELAKEMDSFLSKSKKYYYGTMAAAFISIVLAIISIVASLFY